MSLSMLIRLPPRRLPRLVNLFRSLAMESTFGDNRGQENKVDKVGSRRFELEDHADVYAKYRPQIPVDVVEEIAEYVVKGGVQRGLAVDLGCGSGQSTVPFAPYFEKVIGVDISEAQIARAPRNITNVEFRQSSAEELGFLEDNSVDLVSVANGLHWFNFDIFYPEVKRVLRPGGTFCGFSFGILTCRLSNDAGDQTLRQVTHGTMKEFWHKANYHVASKYVDIPLPFKDSLRVERSMMKQMSISAICGYVETNSFYQVYLQKYPEATLVPDLKKKLNAVYKVSDAANDPEILVDTTWPIVMLFGRK